MYVEYVRELNRIVFTAALKRIRVQHSSTNQKHLSAYLLTTAEQNLSSLSRSKTGTLCHHEPQDIFKEAADFWWKIQGSVGLGIQEMQLLTASSTSLKDPLNSEWLIQAREPWSKSLSLLAFMYSRTGVGSFHYAATGLFFQSYRGWHHVLTIIGGLLFQLGSAGEGEEACWSSSPVRVKINLIIRLFVTARL